MFDEQEPQEDPDRGRVPTVVEGSRITPTEVGSDLGIQPVIIREPVELLEDQLLE